MNGRCEIEYDSDRWIFATKVKSIKSYNKGVAIKVIDFNDQKESKEMKILKDLNSSQNLNHSDNHCVRLIKQKWNISK